MFFPLVPGYEKKKKKRENPIIGTVPNTPIFLSPKIIRQIFHHASGGTILQSSCDRTFYQLNLMQGGMPTPGTAAFWSRST